MRASAEALLCFAASVQSESGRYPLLGDDIVDGFVIGVFITVFETKQC